MFASADESAEVPFEAAALPLGDWLPFLAAGVLKVGVDTVGVDIVAVGAVTVGVDTVGADTVEAVSTPFVRNPPSVGSMLGALLLTALIGEKMLSTLFCPSSGCATGNVLDGTVMANGLDSSTELGTSTTEDGSISDKIAS